MLHYRFELLNPKKDPVSCASNSWLFDLGVAFGIDVNDSELKTMLLEKNITNVRKEDVSIIDWAERVTLPSNTLLIVSDHVDVEIVMAMAILEIRGTEDIEFLKRINMVKDLSGSPYSGTGSNSLTAFRQYPDVLTDMNIGSNSNTKAIELLTIEEVILEDTIPLSDRVDTMQKWVLFGEMPNQQYFDIAKNQQLKLIEAFKSNKIRYELYYDGELKFGESSKKGFRSSLITVTLTCYKNNGKICRDFTISTIGEGFVDLDSALIDLNQRESGWRGDSVCIRSPSGGHSNLDINLVIRLIAKYLY
jgi:hypothetical protein